MNLPGFMNDNEPPPQTDDTLKALIVSSFLYLLILFFFATIFYYIDKFIYSSSDMFDYSFFATVCFSTFFLIKVYVSMLSFKWRVPLYLFVLVGFMDLGLGIFNMNYEREDNSIDYVKIEDWRAGKLDDIANYYILNRQKDYTVLGKKTPIMYNQKLGSYGVKGLSEQEGFKFYEKILLPEDFRSYWGLIDSLGNNTPNQLIIDYYAWQFPEYKIYIKTPFIPCGRLIAEDWEDISCDLHIFEPLREDNIEPYYYSGYGYSALKERFSIYYTAIKEIFFPGHIPTYLKNDPYFLIEQGKYKQAEIALKKLPERRRLFCKQKLQEIKDQNNGEYPTNKVQYPIPIAEMDRSLENDVNITISLRDTLNTVERRKSAIFDFKILADSLTQNAIFKLKNIQLSVNNYKFDYFYERSLVDGRFPIYNNDPFIFNIWKYGTDHKSIIKDSLGKIKGLLLVIELPMTSERLEQEEIIFKIFGDLEVSFDNGFEYLYERTFDESIIFENSFKD